MDLDEFKRQKDRVAQAAPLIECVESIDEVLRFIRDGENISFELSITDETAPNKETRTYQLGSENKFDVVNVLAARRAAYLKSLSEL